jgi:hypothetical protein
MNVENAQKELARKEAAPAELIEEKDGLVGGLEGLKAKRTAAVKALANGDEDQRIVILELEDRAASIPLQIEVQEARIAQAQVALKVAHTALETAQANAKAELEARLRAREQCQNIRPISEVRNPPVTHSLLTI